MRPRELTRVLVSPSTSARSCRRLRGGAPASAGATARPAALALAPTRELAAQIAEATEPYAKLFGAHARAHMRVACVYGGVPVSQHVQELQKGARGDAASDMFLVATPGRLVDLLERRALDLSSCAHFVLDEADRMLDMGFEPQLKATVAALPAERQTLLFSATWPKAVRKLAAALLRSDHTTEIGVSDRAADNEPTANKSVTQRFVEASDDEKDEKLYHLLCGLPEGDHRVVIFANTKRRVEMLEKLFWKEGFGTCGLHGDKSQPERMAALDKFKRGERPLLVATDAASRGLDVQGVTHVVNYDMARDVESYVHRIGRSGRAGATGEAITFFNVDYDKECAPALAKIARTAGQEVPPWLARYEKNKASKQWALAKAVMPPAGPA